MHEVIKSPRAREALDRIAALYRIENTGLLPPCSPVQVHFLAIKQRRVVFVLAAAELVIVLMLHVQYL